jgi:hypothetical protein
MAVPVLAGREFTAGEPARLFRTPLRSAGSGPSGYDAAGDGQRFLMSITTADPNAQPITVILNWVSRLKPAD